MSDTDKPAEPIVRQFAIVEIFGHRKHWAEIADVERAGGKFLRVHDVETDEVHNYGAAAVFNIHEISEARLNAHLAEVAAYKQATAEREARWAAEEEARRNARLLPPAQDALHQHARVTLGKLGSTIIQPTEEELLAWTGEMCAEAINWASAAFAKELNGELDVVVPDRPEFIWDMPL